MNSISAQDLKALLTADDEIALLDVRERGQYGEGHPFFCVPFPYSRLEALAPDLLPCKHAHLVLIDDGNGIAERAATVFESLDYNQVSVLDGGAPAWATAGFTLYKGEHVVSKTYGELLEHEADTPRLTATELNDLLARDPSVVILDSRSPAEFRKMSLPGAICCPNAELGYRIQSLVPDESSTVVITCAGRTRSILGVEGLRVLNAKNPLFALENGTQGWRLAGFDLDHGVSPQHLPSPDEEQIAALSSRATDLINVSGLPLITAEQVAEWLGSLERTTYLLDVRSKSEFDQAHWPGARHAPGGQLLQATDHYVAVRNARIVLSDDNRLRAATTAIRLQDMGHDVYLLDVDAHHGVTDTERKTEKHSGADSAFEFRGESISEDTLILDASPSMSFRDGHIDGAQWVTRARLDELTLTDTDPVLVTGQDAVLIDGVLAEFRTMGLAFVESGVGNPKTWADAGYTVVSTPDAPADEDCIDFLFFVNDRHDDNMDAARQYLEWEIGLVDQLDEQERSVLNPRTNFAAA